MPLHYHTPTPFSPTSNCWVMYVMKRKENNLSFITFLNIQHLLLHAKRNVLNVCGWTLLPSLSSLSLSLYSINGKMENGRHSNV